jgi:hypothetical protein
MSSYIQEANKILTQDQRLKFVSFLKILEKKYADISELQEERNLMSSVREFICIENGHPTTHIFQRIAYDFKDFVRKMRCAGKMERVVRLIGQVVVPAVMITSVVVGVIAGFLGLAPVGAIVASAVIGSIAAICAGGLYSLSSFYRLESVD